MTAPLYRPHSRPLTVLHGDLERRASSQAEVFVGTAGSVVERTNAAGFRFYGHQFYDGGGKQREGYVAGPVGSPAADTLADALRSRIRETKELVPSLRLLGREGFSMVDAKTYAALASLANHGVFSAGAMLIGSHAFGVLLNRLGARAAAYATEDVDIARPEALAFEVRPTSDLLAMLRASGIDFAPVPQLDRKAPATSWKQTGRSLFHVNLLAPSRDQAFPTVAVRELGAHATGLPYLGYLLAESQPGMVMAREGCCAVRVPLPERFAVHKLLVSRLRTGRDAKSTKDVHQASALCAVLADTHPGAIESAVAAVPRRARRLLAPALDVARRVLHSHPRALEELGA